MIFNKYKKYIADMLEHINDENAIRLIYSIVHAKFIIARQDELNKHASNVANKIV